jgi:hypothetical protein
MKAIFALFFLLLSTLTTTALAIAGNPIPSIERKALISIYLNTGGDDWRTNKGWKDNPLESDGFSKLETECDWFGVTCDDKKERVIAIELCANKLTGKLPKDIGDFHI